MPSRPYSCWTASTQRVSRPSSRGSPPPCAAGRRGCSRTLSCRPAASPGQGPGHGSRSSTPSSAGRRGCGCPRRPRRRKFWSGPAGGGGVPLTQRRSCAQRRLRALAGRRARALLELGRHRHDATREGVEHAGRVAVLLVAGRDRRHRREVAEEHAIVAVHHDPEQFASLAEDQVAARRWRSRQRAA